MHHSYRSRGFTLIELLIVIGIIGFLAAAILVAVDPVKRIQDSRNSQRWSEVNAVLNGLLKKQVDDRALFNGGDGAGGGNIIRSHATNAQVIIDNDGGAEDTATIDCTTLTTPGWANLCPGADAAGLTADDTAGNCMADLDGLTPEYLAEIPEDPGTPSATGTSGYYIHRSSGGRITIGACDAEQGATISVKR